MSALTARLRALLLVAATMALVAGASSIFVPSAFGAGAGPWWRIGSEEVPASLPAGGLGQINVVASNLGDTPVDAGKEPVKLTIKLPSGLSAATITGKGCSLATLTCTLSEGAINPYEQEIVWLRVKVGSVSGSLPVQASVEGGGAATVTRTLQVQVNSNAESPVFGVEEYALEPFNENGSAATLAGSQPFQLTTTLVMNQILTSGAGVQPVALPKDLGFHLPPGLIGNPTAGEPCTMVDFFSFVSETNLCAPGSVVGVATVTVDEPSTLEIFTRTVPVFNLVPAQGEPARFGFEVAGVVPVVIDTSVRSGQDYGVNVSVRNATQTAGLLSSQVTLWGVPGDPRHDNARGWECVAGGMFAGEAGKKCPEVSELPEEPFLTLPTSCARDPQAEPLRFPLQADSWADPLSPFSGEYVWQSEAGEPLGFEGCPGLPFSPEIDVEPEQHTASTPTGLDVSVTVPQTTTLTAGEPAEADVRDTTVTLPEGVMLSPSAANGLEACSEAQIGFTGFNQASRIDEFDTAPVSCPDGSKVGTVRIRTPLLSHELEGAAYLASPAPKGEAGQNPFGSLVALYIVAEDPVSGVLVKLAGEGHLDENTLRISTSFKNTPQVPFEELSLHLFGGQRASVTTPPLCGSYQTDALFVPWSNPEVSVPPPPTQFPITSGVGGSACPSGIGFSPGFVAGGSTQQAGAFTGFSMELTRPDGDQALSTVSMHLPSGIAALLSSVELCSEAQAVVSECPAGSLVGEAIAVAGLGSEPYVQRGGKVYITGPYEDAPFGLEIVTSAKAGPFDLGYVTVRSRLYVDPSTASVTIVSNPIPTQIKGIPLQLKRVIVNVNRPAFEFNPTSCEPMSIDGTITGARGGAAGVSSPFQAGNCEALPFSPELSASAVGHGSKTEGTTFAVTVRSGGTNASGVAQAGIAKVQLQLPIQLSSRLPTLQKACVDAVFNANPASCDEGSVIGYATIHTPVLKNPLTGPAYLVSHGGAAFPDVEFVLQGENIMLVLDGKTDIKGEVTYSKFESTPDAPFTVFETVLPAGPHGVLTPNVAESKRFSLCGETLTMPTTMIAQNGLRIEHETKVQVTGCTEVKGVQVNKLTPAQKLKHALRACRRKHKHSKKQRAKCERQAHTHYTRLALAACRHQHKHANKARKDCEHKARKRYAAKSARHAGKSKGSKGQGAA
jgi:hypothetical protein